MIVEIETGLLRDALEKMAGELPDLIAGALESALVAPVTEPAEPERLPLEEPTFRIGTKTEDTTDGGRRLYRTRYQFVEYNPARSADHRWRAKDPRPHDGESRPELGTFATEAEAVLAVLAALVDAADPAYSGATAPTSALALVRALSRWISASRRKAERVAAEPDRSAYVVELALGMADLTARPEA